MSSPSSHASTTVASLWRYPVKSMQGEELNASVVGERGLLGDRAYALVDAGDGKIASAKNPRKWPSLFAFRANYCEEPRSTTEPAPVRITLPDGKVLDGARPDLPALLEPILGRDAVLKAAGGTGVPPVGVLEEYWPDLEGLNHRDAVTDEAMPAGTFFDLAPVHLLTTATLARLSALHPQGRFAVRRFRPNLVVAVEGEPQAFVENDWVGRTLLVGSEVRLRIVRPCGRCVMTTLPQADLPHDPGILRTAVQHNSGNVGVYATVLHGGIVQRGDGVRLE
ncbi:MAG TPA: MOSC N-terminal beta barrel domain-containing protein [Gemmataceae bacterium]|nr:MOSC N-terminal beta barrel domain-containing protein [Gemmataceae bacterium]